MKPSAADLKSLAVFRAVAEHQGFAGAQTALNMSPSAISFHIKALEERVGFVLCRRGRQGFELTGRGRIAYERAKAVLASIEDFDNEMGELRSTAVGTLRLGLVDNTVSDPDPPMHTVIREFLRKNARARLDIQIGSPDDLLVAVANGEVQLAILPESEQMEGLQSRRLYTERHSLYCSPDHPLFMRDQTALSIEEIATYRFVVRPYANLRELGSFPGAEVGAHASNMEAQALFILSGHFIGMLPDHYASHWVARQELRALLPHQLGLDSPFYMVSRSGRRPSLIARNFIQELVGQSWEKSHE